MEFRQLKTFVSIAKLGSFIQAANTLGYAPSTITGNFRLIKRLCNCSCFFISYNKKRGLASDGFFTPSEV